MRITKTKMKLDCSELEGYIKLLRSSLKNGEFLEADLSVNFRRYSNEIKVLIDEKNPGRIKSLKIVSQPEMPLPIMNLPVHFTAEPVTGKNLSNNYTPKS